MTPDRQIKVLLADDHQSVRQGLRALLHGDVGLKVIGEARNGRDAVAKAIRLRPDVVLMDISMPIMNGLEATRQILSRRSSVSIIVLSAHVDEEYVERAKAVGAAGFISKQVSSESLTWVIREVAMGRYLCDPIISAGPACGEDWQLDHNGAARSRHDRLTIRESELLQLVAEGSPKRQMASKLCISLATVERLLDALMAKLSMSCIANLAAYAVACGYIESDVVLTIT
jgi:DNA-binding NarL/FixJ family response regulator